MSRPPWLVAAAAGVSLLVLSACVPIGERPTLGEEVSSARPAEQGATGIAVVDALLERLDGVDQRTFTVTYTVTRKLGPVSAEAAVAQLPPRRTVRIGSTVFLTGEEQEDKTCSTDDNLCDVGIIEQRVSDLGIGSMFYGPGPATQLRVAVDRRAGEPTTSTRDVGGVSADCVSVPVGTGVEQYCVSPQGPIAYLDTASVTIELTAATDTADPSALAPTGEG